MNILLLHRENINIEEQTNKILPASKENYFQVFHNYLNEHKFKKKPSH